MKYDIKTTKKFEKDLKLIEKQGKDVGKLVELIDRLAAAETLEPRYKDHALAGRYRGFRECHIEPDWLLVYQVFNRSLVLVLSRTGSHSELFS